MAKLICRFKAMSWLSNVWSKQRPHILPFENFTIGNLILIYFAAEHYSVLFWNILLLNLLTFSILLSKNFLYLKFAHFIYFTTNNLLFSGFGVEYFITPFIIEYFIRFACFIDFIAE